MWVPAHGKGTVKSDGSLVNGQDREANDLADEHAKEAVETHRLHPNTIKRWELLMEQRKQWPCGRRESRPKPTTTAWPL